MKKLLLLALLLASFPALGAKKKETKTAAEPVEFNVEIPRGELGLAQQGPAPLPSREKLVEFSLSAYEPRSFIRSSYGAQASRLERGKLPLIAVGAGFPVWKPGSDLELELKTGLAYTRLERSGPARTAFATGDAKQALSLLLLRAGPELRGFSFLGGKVEPFLGGAAVPAFLFGPASPFEGAVSATGLGFEGSGGLRVFPGFLTGFLGGGQGSLTAGVHYLAGDLGGSSLRGWAAFLGLGVAL